MFRKNDNKFMALIGDNSLTSALPAAGTVITSANLPNGAIVVTDLGLRRLDDSTSGSDLTAMANGEKFLIVQGLGASKPLLKSEALTLGQLSIKAQQHVISRQQVTMIGYNGTTGSLPTANDTSYFVKVRKNDNDAANRSQPQSLFGQFKTDASGTQEELAFGLVHNLNKNMEDEPANNYLKGEVVGDGTVAAITGTSTISKFTNGSKEVSVWIKVADATDDFSASTATVTIGDIVNVPSSGGTSFTFDAVALGSSAGRHMIYIGETSYDVADTTTAGANATAIAVAINAGTQASASVSSATVTITLKPCTTGLPLVLFTNDDSAWTEITTLAIATGDANEVKYKVAATTAAAATFTLTTAYEGPTSYFFDGTAPATNTGIATVTNYGIKLTGKKADFNVNTYRNYFVNRFSASFSDTTILVTATQGALTGTGMGAQAQLDEYMTWGFEGQNEMLAIPSANREQVASECAEYSVMSISWTETITGLVGQSGAKGTVLIYCELDGDSVLPATNASGEVADVIGDLVGIASTDMNK